MTLTSTTVKLTYNGDGAQTAFPVTFNFWDLDDLKVILRDENVTPATETTMTRGATYNVTGGNGSTGTVTIITPPSSNIPVSGEKLIIKSDVPSTQTTTLPLGGAIPSASLEQRLDKNVRLIQQAEEVLSRAPLLEETTSLTNPAFPAPGAGNYIRWAADGLSLEAVSAVNDSGNFLQSGTGAVTRSVTSKIGEIISVKDFGAVGDGVTDDTAAIQAAIDAASAGIEGKRLWFPEGEYIVSDTLAITSQLEIVGTGLNDSGTVIKAAASTDKAIFKITANAEIRNLSIKGNDDITLTNQALIWIEDTGNIHLHDLFLQNSYDHVKITGTIAAFYINIYDTVFENSRNSFLKIDNSSSDGVDLIMSRCRFRGHAATYAWDFLAGLGSIICSDTMISITGAPAPSVRLVNFQSYASLYGGAQFTNCVFENLPAGTNEAVRINGTSGLPWKEMHFVNCLFTGGGGEALRLGFTRNVDFISCTFSSSSSSGIIEFEATKSALQCRFISPTFEAGTSIPVYTAAGDTALGMYIVSPKWTGSTRFIDMPGVTVGNIKDLDIIGGDIGSHATPINLSDYKNTKKQIICNGDNFGPLQRATYTGSLDGSGNATFAHNITELHKKIGYVGAWYKGGSAEALELTIDFIDGANIDVSGGSASGVYRVTVLYNTTVDSW